MEPESRVVCGGRMRLIACTAFYVSYAQALCAPDLTKYGSPLPYTRTPGSFNPGASKFYPGSDLLSHAVASAVPSALEGLTAVFGMGTGVAPPALPPGNI